MIAGTSAYKLFGARLEYRVVGTYVEAYEAAAGAVWSEPVSGCTGYAPVSGK